MAIVNLNAIKNWFKTGLKPNQEQFWDMLDSLRHKNEKVPAADVEGIDDLLFSKADKVVLDDHLTNDNAHASLFGAKEDKSKKGVAGGYAPLNEFTKLASQYLNIVNDLVTGGSDSLLSAEQGKILKTQIDGINLLLTSDNVNLDNVQELVDAIETIQMSLSTILVNDLTTGGTTKALTAEMGKSLKALYDTLSTNKVEKGGYNGTAQELKNGIDSIYQPDTVIRSITPTRVGNVFTYLANGYEYLLSKTRVVNLVDFVTTISSATVDYKRVDLIYGKADGTLGKVQGVESLTIAVRPDPPAGTIAISFINVFGSSIENPTPISKDISIQDSLGTEKFKVSDYLRFRGASFNSASKQIEIDPLIPLSAFLDVNNGNDLIASVENANKPFKTLEKLISSLPVTKGETYTIYMIGAVVNVKRRLPVRNFDWISYTGTTLDFTNCMEDDGVTSANFVLRRDLVGNPMWTFQNGNISLKCTYVGQKGFGWFGDNGVVLKGTINALDWKSVNDADRGFLLNNGTDITFNTVYDSPQITPLFGSAESNDYDVTIKNFIVQYGQYVNNQSRMRIENINKVGTNTFSINISNYNGKPTYLYLGNVNLQGCVILPRALKVEFNGTISSTCTIDFVGSVVISGNLISTTYCYNQWVAGEQIFRNFNGKLNDFQMVGGSVVFENCIIESNTRLLRKYTSVSTRQDIIYCKGFNVFTQVDTTKDLLYADVSGALDQSILLTDSGTVKTNCATYGKTVKYVNTTSTFKEKMNEVIIRSKYDLLNRVLSSTTTYIVDGIITLGTGESIEVPIGGLTITGYGFDVSRIEKNVAGQSIFTSPGGGSGNFVTSNIQYNSGLGSVFNILDSDGSHAMELNDVNFQSCNSLGTINHYRQFTATTCGIYGCSDGFTLEGSWSGFKMVNTNAFSFGASGTLIKKGAATLFTNRLYLDLNLSLPIGAKICDFQDSNFTSNKLLQVVNCLVKVNGVIDPSTTGATFPNISPFSAKSYFTNNIGVKNSFNEPYGLKTTNLSTYANDTDAAAGNVQVGEVYVETTTGYFKTRLV